jgi:hypothetical protein
MHSHLDMALFKASLYLIKVGSIEMIPLICSDRVVFNVERFPVERFSVERFHVETLLVIEAPV